MDITKVIQWVKASADCDIGDPTYDKILSDAVETRLAPALYNANVLFKLLHYFRENRSVLIAKGPQGNPYELPLSKSVTVPITDIFNGLCWLASVTLLNAEVRSSPKWYSRRLAIFAKIFQTVKDWLLGGLEEPMNNAFPYCICVVLSTNPCFSVGKSGFADDGRMYATFACSLPPTGNPRITKADLRMIRERYFCAYTPKEASLSKPHANSTRYTTVRR